MGLVISLSIGSYFWTSANELERSIKIQAADNASEYANRANIAVKQDCAAITSPTAKDECINEKRDPYHKEQRDERDLEAQQIMAVWTSVMGKAAIIGMGVGILGLCLIFTTFWETRKAAQSSQKTLSAFIGKERAVLLVTDLSWENRRTGTHLVLKVENVGLSLGTTKMVKWQLTDKVVWPDKLNESISFQRPIKPGQTDGTIALLVGPQTNSLFLAGEVTYETLGKQEFASYFAFNVTPMDREAFLIPGYIMPFEMGDMPRST